MHLGLATARSPMPSASGSPAVRATRGRSRILSLARAGAGGAAHRRAPAVRDRAHRRPRGLGMQRTRPRGGGRRGLGPLPPRRGPAGTPARRRRRGRGGRGPARPAGASSRARRECEIHMARCPIHAFAESQPGSCSPSRAYISGRIGARERSGRRAGRLRAAGSLCRAARPPLGVALARALEQVTARLATQFTSETMKTTPT